MFPDFVRLWILSQKIGNFFEIKLRIYKNFNLKIQIDFFLLGPTFFLINVPVRRLYWSDVCTGPMFVLSDVCKSYVCTVRRLWVRRLYWYHNIVCLFHCFLVITVNKVIIPIFLRIYLYLSDHNLWTPWVISFKFWLGNSLCSRIFRKWNNNKLANTNPSKYHQKSFKIKSVHN